MSLTYVALLPVPLLCPQLQLCIGLPSIQFSCDLSGALALNASLTVSPPTIAIYLAAEIETQVLLALSVSLSLPTVEFDLSVSVSIEVSLALSLSLLLSFDLGFSLSGFLSASITLFALTYEGAGSSLGAGLTTELAATWPDGSPATGACNAIILGATSTGAQAALQAFLDGCTWSAGITGVTLGSIGGLSVVTAKAETQASAAITAKASAQAAVSAALTARGSIAIPTPAVTLAALAAYQVKLAAQVGLAPPAISAAVTATANLAAGISASAGFMAALGAAMGNWGAELFVYSYSGTGSGMGAAVTTALATHWGDGVTPSSGTCLAIALGTTDSFSGSVVGAFFGGA